MPSSVFEEAASPRIQIDSSFAGIWTGKLRTFDLNIKEPTGRPVRPAGPKAAPSATTGP
jgi:hypothetical protein